MLIFKTLKHLQDHLSALRKKDLSIGFVPTMGALHNGHISLTNQAKKETDIVVVSIFVNPTQFDDDGDLKKYPRTLEKDALLCSENGVDIIFAPTVDVIYPSGEDWKNPFDFGDITTVMEGKYRDGHFDGVAQVVSRLLDIVWPDKIFMGQKDYQQTSVIFSMLQQSNYPTELVICPTLRAENGLAMSSRNVRLSEQEREEAGIIYQTLKFAKSKLGDWKIMEITKEAQKILSGKGYQLDYFEVSDGISLAQLNDDEPLPNKIVICVALFCGEVRLIDNIVWEKNKE